jgi:crotonobetainyl-CoA:carnitine CoA-transferase CaiB-like acyl-CoA transferase
MSRAPLDGRIVIDLTTALAGPYATLMLGGLGARVIKVENPRRGGDSSRTNPPYLTPDGLSPVRSSSDDMSVSMLLRGRNKESIALDLKTDVGRRVLMDLIARADVLVENYSAGVTGRLGIDYDSVRAINPRLVYTSITGFGSDAGDGGKAMDTIVQALSGIMMTAGEPGDSPVRFGLPIADLAAPLFAVIGTVSALLEADRSGEGQHVDVSMLGAMTSLVACEPFDAFESMGYPTRTGDYVPRLAPFGTFRAADGWFAVCGPTDAFAAGVFRAIGEPELADDPRFAGRDARVSNSDDLHERMSEWAKHQTVADAVAAFEANGVPSAPVRPLADAVRDPRVQARNEVVRIRHPRFDSAEELWGTGIPITFSSSEIGLDRPAHALGADTDSVLTGLLGYTPDDIAALDSSRVG